MAEPASIHPPVPPSADPSVGERSAPTDKSSLTSLIRTRRRWGRLFEALVRNTGMGIYVADAGGNYLMFNPECERLTGVSEAGLRAAGAATESARAGPAPAPTDPAAAVGPCGGCPSADLLRPPPALFERRAPTAARQLQITCPDGTARWLEITWVPVSALGGRTELVVAFVRDIGEQKLIQTHMARLEKLAALGELTASIAHEVRNPLAAMKLGLNALAEELAESSAALAIIDEVAGELGRLDRVVSRLLDFARVKESEFKETDLPALIERTFGYVRNQAKGRNIDLKVEAAPDVRPVRCDPDQIQQVLLNVILNAFHAMKQGGVLTAVVDRAGEVKLPSGEPGPTARIRVIDTGTGIPAAVLHKVFDPFFSTRPGGTGLGLSVSLQLVSRHGGDMDIASEVGKGTTVTILLPEGGPTGAGAYGPQFATIGAGGAEPAGGRS
jgi:signal transduction histidine kinase